jgi:hypothetical protein
VLGTWAGLSCTRTCVNSDFAPICHTVLVPNHLCMFSVRSCSCTGSDELVHHICTEQGESCQTSSTGLMFRNAAPIEGRARCICRLGSWVHPYCKKSYNLRQRKVGNATWSRVTMKKREKYPLVHHLCTCAHLLARSCWTSAKAIASRNLLHRLRLSLIRMSRS